MGAGEASRKARSVGCGGAGRRCFSWWVRVAAGSSELCCLFYEIYRTTRLKNL